MGSNNDLFIALLEQQPRAESYTSRIQFLLAKLCQQGSNLIFKAPIDLNAIKVPKDDTNEFENHRRLDEHESSSFELKKGSTLIFDLSRLPYQQSDHYLSIQHVIDNEGQLYRLCSNGVFGGKKSVRYFALNLLEPNILVTSVASMTKPRESKAEKRLKVVNNWMEAKKTELGLSPEASPQDVHNALTQIEKRERTQNCYWSDWNKEGPTLFPDGAETRNFFTKNYRQIKFSRGIRG